MSAERATLATLIDSVADGTPVDWDAVEAAAAGDDNVRRRLRHLQLVARLATVHDRAAAEEFTADAAEPGTGPAPADADILGRWGHLVLIEKIGEGSFGEVYQARDAWLDRDVALKVLRHPTGDESSMRRLLREARTLARVRHEHVVTVHGADVHGGRVGIWMELLRGQTLEQRLGAQGPSSAAEATAVGQELCSALAAVHAAGLVHRDVKASNVMREHGGRLVLMDFGAGELRGGDTAAIEAAGTPLYLAPELLRGGAATPQADLYALGVLLYRLVTASYPVNAETLDGLRAAHERGERVRLRDARPELPEAFVAIVEKALDADPRCRYATAGEMAEALSRLVPKDRVTFDPRIAALATAAVLVAGVGAWQLSRVLTPPSTPGLHLVAVLPLSADAGVDDDFADGMTDAIIQELSALDAVRVMPHTAVARFKKRDRSLAEIIALLKAESPLASAGALSLVEGSIRGDGAIVRINVRLFNASAETHWSRTFQRPMQSVVELQQEVAREVAEDLPVVISAGARNRWARSHTVAQDSYDQYLRGRAFLNRDSRSTLHQAIAMFAEAIRLDPRNSYAHAAMAVAYARLAGGRSDTPEQTTASARSAAKAALALDPGSAEAHTVLAEMAFFADWNWTAAEHDYRRALSLNPSLEYARERYSMFLASRGRLAEALEQMAEARQVNPASLTLAAAHAALLRYARRYPEAATEYQRVLEKDPEHVGASVGLGRLYNATGQFQGALTIFERLHDRDSASSYIEGEMAQALAGLGRRAEALEVLERLEQDFASGSRLVEPGTLAFLHASLGHRDRALDWLDRAVTQRSSGVLWLQVDSRVDSLRADSRFDAFLRQLQLP